MDPLTKASSLASGDPWIGIPITPYMYPSFLTWFPEPVSFLLIYLPRQQLSSGYQRYNGHWGTLHHQTGFGKRRCRSTTRTATLYRQFLNGSSWVAFFFNSANHICLVFASRNDRREVPFSFLFQLKRDIHCVRLDVGSVHKHFDILKNIMSLQTFRCFLHVLQYVLCRVSIKNVADNTVQKWFACARNAENAESINVQWRVRGHGHLTQSKEKFV